MSMSVARPERPGVGVRSAFRNNEERMPRGGFDENEKS
jgi:hypothetical protein